MPALLTSVLGKSVVSPSLICKNSWVQAHTNTASCHKECSYHWMPYCFSYWQFKPDKTHENTINTSVQHWIIQSNCRVWNLDLLFHNLALFILKPVSQIIHFLKCHWVNVQHVCRLPEQLGQQLRLQTLVNMIYTNTGL